MGPGSVAVAVLDHTDIQPMELYELAIACAVFGVPQPDLADRWYDFRLCVEHPESTRSGNGFGVRSDLGLDDLVGADTVIVPSVPDECVEGDREMPPQLLKALRRAHESGARIVSLCNGAFALAEAGLLDGKRATAHWLHTDLLAAKYPSVTVDPSVLYVDEGTVLTGAGVSAGLDVCLHIVRRDLGAHVANQLARRLVVHAHRAGTQAQVVEQNLPADDTDTLGPALQWAIGNLDRPITVDDMARRAGMSTRTYFRRVQSATGTTPLRWLLDQRLARAQALLETTDLSVEVVSRKSGLGTAANLRRLFTRHFRVSPRDYRREFRAMT
ncbi:AraC family transcriptional regulator [Saccharothrix sp. ALI-22-I]|uniref:GlxA family transcriptional regulator n=1 Tax=Saccharothrix sp. ALI-22-I TaxID=1933778 RepID=UPI00097C0C6E|nr:helix-turn-helix domain-containing protein [Saccharothrix sp. ALI-22-I]ONI92820.1 AraC family transcriptional regulator [Saccharothrix sp. ALI-22-I]